MRKCSPSSFSVNFSSLDEILMRESRLIWWITSRLEGFHWGCSLDMLLIVIWIRSLHWMWHRSGLCFVMLQSVAPAMWRPPLFPPPGPPVAPWRSEECLSLNVGSLLSSPQCHLHLKRHLPSLPHSQPGLPTLCVSFWDMPGPLLHLFLHTVINWY